MKYLAAVFALAGAAASAAPPPPHPALVAPDLRQALQQYHRDGASGPRQLTPVERAQLRRQLSEYGPPPRPEDGPGRGRNADPPRRKEP
ncbi:hypothetical protein H8N03_10085 [Ramlibacter sp. USB13]|uniref:DUF3106 domain-containing protein n=1 Tax=Ramlibacter cellulosilyticus TaxID=2764187 RepID=A0A923SB00_9BURK|nr:hypothetical protein [Ramlibacter cellulosilyticus]MBC5783294.1 hypothetical protein [Ramlibacter cellulosilyticus]